ncbi:CBASS oligonucleotide cyclase [Hyphomonas sp. KY3]|uniref:CBASS oligonucleotide cyclase n=1 Tax=Hyphomonas sp. KY3 TaxID=2016196 RepID=UPI001A907301|nr:CBASS oligonucleotide cyclase [Hyphomonas sp. KY3]QSR22033.1 nucleotidyltransferase [Hyphomonas sp. KY3]|tara:strand:+ start:119 stop:1015 length:897 start_codon:yes stop_codon:yes gene_type:complete
MSLSTYDAFMKFKSRLELSDTEQKDASKRQKDVRDTIDADFHIDTSFLTGSYGRNTKTKPLKDVDIFFVLGANEAHRRNEAPAKVLDAFKATLEKAYGANKVDKDGDNRRCVTVEFDSAVPTAAEDGKVLSVDAVPAFKSGGAYEIPDRHLGQWIKTDPSIHKNKATAKNKQMGGTWVPLVKMLKAWNRSQGKPIKPSFLIEVMAHDLVQPTFTSYPDEIRRFFGAAQDAVSQDWPDPAGYGPPVSDQMTPAKIDIARAALRQADMQAAKAQRLETQGKQGEALKTWRGVLGDYFPLR